MFLATREDQRKQKNQEQKVNLKNQFVLLILQTDKVITFTSPGCSHQLRHARKVTVSWSLSKFSAKVYILPFFFLPGKISPDVINSLLSFFYYKMFPSAKYLIWSCLKNDDFYLFFPSLQFLLVLNVFVINVIKFNYLDILPHRSSVIVRFVVLNCLRC